MYFPPSPNGFPAVCFLPPTTAPFGPLTPNGLFDVWLRGPPAPAASRTSLPSSRVLSPQLRVVRATPPPTAPWTFRPALSTVLPTPEARSPAVWPALAMAVLRVRVSGLVGLVEGGMVGWAGLDLVRWEVALGVNVELVWWVLWWVGCIEEEGYYSNVRDPDLLFCSLSRVPRARCLIRLVIVHKVSFNAYYFTFAFDIIVRKRTSLIELN